MKKITLDLDTLSVQSFQTTERASRFRGTVRAAGATEQCESQGLSYCGSCWPTDCLDPSCGPPCEPTFPDSCHGTCIGDTCDGACASGLNC